MPNFIPHLLLTAANSKQDLPSLADEFEGINRHLRKAVEKQLCKIEERSNLKIDDLPEIFHDTHFQNKISIFHYAGHAGNQQIDTLFTEGLAKLLSTQKNLVLIFLNACSTAEQLPYFLEKTQQIPCIIVTNKDIEDAIASRFAVHFYSSLGIGDTIEVAFKKAMGFIKTEHGNQVFRKLFKHKQNDSAPAIPWQIHFNNPAFKDWNLAKAADKPLASLPYLVFEKRDLPDVPFIGLQYYTEEYTPIFFGRGYEISDLYYKVVDKTDHPIVLLCGQSGVGKSSLLSSGLLPRLRNSFHCPSEHYIRRNQQKGFHSVFEEVLETKTKENLQEKWMQIEADNKKPLLLVLDQVEEIFTSQAKEGEKEAFFQQLQSLFSRENEHKELKGKLIISFRKEYLAEMKKALKESNIPHQSEYFVETLNKKNIVEAIRGLALPPYSQQLNQIIQEKYQLTIEEELAELIADHLLKDDKSAIAPSLQILLTQLWKEVENQPQKVFTKNLYRSLEAKTLEEYLDKQLQELGNWNKNYLESGFALSILKQHTTEEITAGEYVLQDAIADFERERAVKEVINKLRELYLLTDLKNSTSRLSHDTLAKYVHKKFNKHLYPAQKAKSILATRLQTQEGLLTVEELAIIEAGKLGMTKLDEREEELIAKSKDYHKTQARNRNIKRYGGIFLLIVFILFAGPFISVSFLWVFLLVVLMYYI